MIKTTHFADTRIYGLRLFPVYIRIALNIWCFVQCQRQQHAFSARLFSFFHLPSVYWLRFKLVFMVLASNDLSHCFPHSHSVDCMQKMWTKTAYAHEMAHTVGIFLVKLYAAQNVKYVAHFPIVKCLLCSISNFIPPRLLVKPMWMHAILRWNEKKIFMFLWTLFLLAWCDVVIMKEKSYIMFQESTECSHRKRNMKGNENISLNSIFQPTKVEEVST